MPTGRLLVMLPTSPASSYASRAATSHGFRPLIGHPFGITQRPVSREVSSMISGRPVVPARNGRAANWVQSRVFLGKVDREICIRELIPQSQGAEHHRGLVRYTLGAR